MARYYVKIVRARLRQVGACTVVEMSVQTLP